LIPLAVFSIVMISAVALMKIYAPNGTGWIAAVIGIAGFILAIVAMFATVPPLTLAIARRFHESAQAKCEQFYLLSLQDAEHVGFSPGHDVQYYDGDSCWDVGFLRLETDRLNYYGDRAAFSLSASQVQEVSVDNHEVLVWKFPWVRISWQQTADSGPQIFRLQMRDATTMKDLRRRTESMAAELEDWRHERKGASTASNLLGLPPLLDDIPQPAGGLPQEGFVSVFVAGLAIGFSSLIAERLTDNKYLHWAIVIAIILLVGFASLGLRRLLARMGSQDH